MTRLFVGNRPGVGPVLKMMRNDGDDPLTVSKTDYGKFLFDSETTNLGYVNNIADLRVNPSIYPPIGSYYLPAGRNENNCNLRIKANYGSQINLYYEGYFSSFGYLPIVEFRTATISPANTFTGPSLDFREKSETGSWVAESRSGYACEFVQTALGGIYPSRPAYFEGMSTNQRVVMTAFDLPLRNVPIPNFSATPITGQETIRISQSMARIALPGRTVAATDPRHYIAHENHIPAKIMRAGDVNIAAGGTAIITTPLPLTPQTYMDFHTKLQSAAEFTHPPFFNQSSLGSDINFSYTVNAQSVTLRNTGGKAITVRYVIFADSEQANTTGGSAVLRKGNDGSQDYVQIKRPGSSDSAPSLNDIIIDSRLAYFPLVKEGFLRWPTDFTLTSGSSIYGERLASVSFPNASGFKPFIKSIVLFDPSTSGFQAVSGWRQVFINAGIWSDRCSCMSSLAHIKTSGTSVDFYMAGDNPWLIRPGGNDYNGTCLGLRYYIFAIPASL